MYLSTWVVASLSLKLFMASMSFVSIASGKNILFDGSLLIAVDLTIWWKACFWRLETILSKTLGRVGILV